MNLRSLQDDNYVLNDNRLPKMLSQATRRDIVVVQDYQREACLRSKWMLRLLRMHQPKSSLTSPFSSYIPDYNFEDLYVGC